MPHTVKVNRRGQITLPAEMRRLLDLKPGSRLRLDERGWQRILEPEGNSSG